MKQAKFLLIFILTLCFIYIFTPVGKERSIELAQGKFDSYCIENRFNCSEFEGPVLSKIVDDRLRIYEFEYQIDEINERIVFEVRIPILEWEKATVGTKSDTELILSYLSIEVES